MFPHKIDTHVSLIILQQSHAQEMFNLIDRNRAHLRRWLIWVDDIIDLASEQKALEKTLIQCAQTGELLLGITYDGALIGNIHLKDIRMPARLAYLGYWLQQNFQGRGIMTNVCRVMIDYAFKTLHLNKITILCATDNLKSCAIPQRLHFVKEGTIRDAQWLYDHYVDLNIYGIKAQEWSALCNTKE